MEGVDETVAQAGRCSACARWKEGATTTDLRGSSAAASRLPVAQFTLLAPSRACASAALRRRLAPRRAEIRSGQVRGDRRSPAGRAALPASSLPFVYTPSDRGTETPALVLAAMIMGIVSVAAYTSIKCPFWPSDSSRPSSSSQRLKTPRTSSHHRSSRVLVRD